MNNLDTMLKYQELDIKLKRVFDKLEKSEASEKMEQARNKFNNAKKTVQDCEKAAESTVAVFDQASAQLTELGQKLSELQLIIENAESEEDLGELVPQLEALKGKVSSFERKLNECKIESEKLVKEYQDANSIGLKMRNIYSAAKAEFTELSKAAEPEITELRRKLKEIEGTIDPETMKMYKALTSENKYPAFVEARKTDKTYSCNGCGMMLSQKNLSTLNENGYCTCETCRRIIYKV